MVPLHMTVIISSRDRSLSALLVSRLQVLQKLPNYTFLPTACSEASKLGASLSSLCLLINRKQTYF